MSEEEKKYNVTILSRRTVSTFPRLGEEVRMVYVTYVAAGLPPATVMIPEEEYSVELEKETIRKDIEERLKRKPETYTV